MTEQEEIILEHTRLAKEYANLPRDIETTEENEWIEQRKRAIEQRIRVLKNIEKKWNVKRL